MQENSGKSIEQLISDLGSDDGMVRQRARYALTQIGEPAVDALIRAFQEKNNPTHYEAAKTLSGIGSTKAIATLINALQDEDFSVRWVAAEGLISIGEPSIRPLLIAMELHAESGRLREGVHHVLHDWITRKLIDEQMRKILLPVLDAYRNFEPAVSTRLAAIEALKQL